MGSVQFEQHGNRHEVALLETIAKRDQEIADLRTNNSRQLKQLFARLLDVVDHFETALALVGEMEMNSLAHNNMKRLYQEYIDLLLQYRIQPMHAVGKPFDPRYHEAVQREQVAGVPEYSVVRELRKGYLYGENVLRPAKVSVAVTPEEQIVEL